MNLATTPVTNESTLPSTIHTISEAMAFWAARTPDAPALRAIDGKTWSHRELLELLGDVADRLAAYGIGRDDRVALVVPPGIDAAIALLGTMNAAVAVPLNHRSTFHEFSRDLRRLSPKLVITDDRTTTGLDVATTLGFRTAAARDLMVRNGDRPPTNAQLPHPDDIAIILHTSGTTEEPKRVPRPHRTYVAAARESQAMTNLTPHDVGILLASLHTNAGVGNLLASLLSGGSCVVAPGADYDLVPAWLADHRPTWFVSTPTEITRIMDAADAAGRDRVVEPDSRLRAIRLGAQPLIPGTIERAEQSFAALVFDGYGMTEASYITGGGPGAHDRRDGTCGRPVSTSIRVLDECDRELPAGIAGAIVVRGPTLFSGYLDDAETNAEVFLPGGWFRTGDLGYLDDDGFLTILGRSNELINRGGEKISPVEVDRVLQRHLAVAEAAAFAVPDPRLGEDIVAAVVLRPGATVTVRVLRRWLLRHLAPTKAPRRIWVVDQLPRTATGKVQRAILTERFMVERGRH